jgi:hypothetical protein
VGFVEGDASLGIEAYVPLLPAALVELEVLVLVAPDPAWGDGASPRPRSAVSVGW